MQYESSLSVLRSAFALATLSVAAIAQSPRAVANEAASAQPPATAALAADFLVPVHTAPADEHGGEYGTWAAGRDYKVSFHDGMTFVPILGRHRQGESLRWRTASVRIGDEELVNYVEPRQRRAGDHRFEYDHGGVVEAYDVRLDGLEQTFVIARRPAQVGDLVVRGAIGGSVRLPERGAHHEPLALTGHDGEAVIGYGAATAIDADGRAFAMTTAVREGTVELRLSAPALAEARYPLVVDPLLTNLILDVDDDIDDVDVFCDRQETQWPVWITYSRYASATDRDLVMRRYQTALTGPGAIVYSDLTSAWSSVGGQLAAVGASNNGRTVVVFTREYPANTKRVRWHSHVKSNFQFNSGIGSLPHFPGTQEWRPDVGGSESPSAGETVLIVYQREDGPTFANVGHSQVRGVKVNIMTGQIGQTFAIGDSGGIDEERPTVNQINDDGTDGWVVAYQVYDNAAGGPWRIAGQRIAGASGADGDPMDLAVAGEHAITPQVAGKDGRYLLVYGRRAFQSDKPLARECRAVWSRRLWWPAGVANATFPNGEHELLADAAEQLAVGSCAVDLATESHWVATYVDQQPGGERLHVDKIGFEGASCEHEVVYYNANWQPTPGAATFDWNGDRFVLAFAVDNGTAATALWATAVTYEAPAPIEHYGSLCGTASNQLFFGLRRIGSYVANFALSTSMADNVAVFGASLGATSAPLDPFGMTGCELLIDPAPMLGTLVELTDTTGQAMVRLAIPSSMPPFELYTQWFLLVPAANPAGIVTSRGMKVPFAR